MAEKKNFAPPEAVEYLNSRLKVDPPINLARLARLRREKRIYGERVGDSKTSMYTKRALDMVTLADVQDKRKRNTKSK